MHSQQVDLDQRLADDLQTVTSPEEIVATTQTCGKVHVDDKLFDYINTLVRRTREWPQFHMGASPRAGIALVQGARTLAAFRGRDYAVPDDVVQIALPALRHRVILTAEADVEGQQVDDLLRELIRTVEVPRLVNPLVLILFLVGLGAFVLLAWLGKIYPHQPLVLLIAVPGLDVAWADGGRGAVYGAAWRSTS